MHNIVLRKPAFGVNRRKITYAQFEEAIKMMAEKKYPGDEGAVDKLKTLITEAKGPELHGATVGGNQ